MCQQKTFLCYCVYVPAAGNQFKKSQSIEFDSDVREMHALFSFWAKVVAIKCET